MEIQVLGRDRHKKNVGYQGFQYFLSVPITNYRWYFLLKFEHFLWISYTTLFKIRRHQRQF